MQHSTVQLSLLSYLSPLQASARGTVLSASPSHRLPPYPPFFNSLARLGGTDKEHLRLGHSLKRDFTSCLTRCRLILPISSDLFPNVLTFSPVLPFLFSLPTFFHPSTLRVFFIFICLILLGLVLFFFFFLTFVLFYSRAD